MVKHIVMWKFKNSALGMDKNEILHQAKLKLEALPAAIQEILSLEVGADFSKNDASFDLALYSEFASRKDLDAYQVHPAHKAVAEFIAQVRTDRVMVDYEV